MKKLIFGLIATVMFGLVGNAQDKNFSTFFSSKEFSLLSEKFSIKTSDVDMKNYASLNHESKLYNIYRVLVIKNDSKNFITFFTDDNGKSYGLAYEKIDLVKGISEHFDEYGNLYATFKVVKSETNYNFIINEVFLPSESGNNVNAKAGCIEKIYKRLKSACESDSFCDMMCDLNPTCNAMLASWAAIFCATR